MNQQPELIVSLRVDDVQEAWDNPSEIGAVVPPDDIVETARGTTDAQQYLDSLIEELWGEWRDEVEDPDSDSQFCEWLVERGWQMPHQDIFNVTIKT